MKKERRYRLGISVDLTAVYGRGIRRGISAFLRVNTNCELAFAWRSSPDELVKVTSEMRLDGLIAQISSDNHMQALKHLRIPVINISNRVRVSPIPRVASNDLETGRMAARNLLVRGFRHFGFAGIRGHHYAELRGNGFVEEVEAAGGVVSSCEHSRDEINGDPAALKQWVKDLPKPVAIFACNDIRALHVQRACMDLSVAIPDEVALCGVDDEEAEGLFAPISLSSIRLDLEKIGYTASEALFRARRNKALIPQETLIAPHSFVNRRSTDIFAMADPRIAKAMSYIHDHLQLSIQIGELVRVSKMSRRSFEQRFQELIGRSPYAQILQMRIGRAKELLASTNLSVAQVGEACGFHVKKFSEIFRAKAGQTPTEYRRKST